MKITKSWISNILLFIGFVLVAAIFYLSYYNDGRWYINLAAFGIPILLLVIIVLILSLLLLKQFVKALLLFLSLGILFKPIGETFSIGYLFKPKTANKENVITVMSFNVSTFNNHRDQPFQPDDSTFKVDFFNYLKKSKDSFDFICFQEFHHDDNDNLRIADEIVKYTKTPYFYTLPIWQSIQEGFFGILTMSKYPIIRRGMLFDGELNTLNRGIYTDVLYKTDTIRIVNLHLHSMNIRFNHFDSIGYVNKIKGIFESLQQGSIVSKEQILNVVEFIKKSPYPVVLCGDFNTFPYGYAYQEIKKHLSNSFEKSGKGFGFTLNLAPYFVRIDNQFVSEQFMPIETKVIKGLHQSDHRPLVCKYRYRKANE